MIILAREARGLSQAELAGQIGMSPTNLSKIERNDIGIQGDVLEKIADVTHFPMHFFYQPGEAVPNNLGYRRRQQVPQKVLIPINARVNVIRRQVQFLTRGLQVVPPTLPVLEVSATQTPEMIAATIRQLWKIESPVIDDLSTILQQQGIAIASFSFNTERVDSRAVLTDDKQPIIVCNSLLQGDRQRFSLAYELGHLIMHTFVPVAADRDITREASAFAAALLMPEEGIKEDFANGISIALLGELKRKWQVSMIALLYRADDLGLLTPNQKRYLLQQFNQLNIRRREPTELDIDT